MQYQPKLDEIEARFDALNAQMADPEVIGDSDRYRKTAKAHSELADIVARYRAWKLLNGHASEAREMAEDTDPELRHMAAEELARLEPELERMEDELKILLLPRDPNDEKNVVLEIRAGTG